MMMIRLAFAGRSPRRFSLLELNPPSSGPPPGADMFGKCLVLVLSGDFWRILVHGRGRRQEPCQASREAADLNLPSSGPLDGQNVWQMFGYRA